MSKDEKCTIFSGSYSHFHFFRLEIFKATTGFHLDMINKDIYNYFSTPVDSDGASLALFMTHSDCDGEWTWKECIRVHQLLQFVKDTGTKISYHETMEDLINGLTYCIDRKIDACFF